MDIVIASCCSDKADSRLTIHHAGKRVAFVADPVKYETSQSLIAARPDDQIPGESTTWRGRVVAVNNGSCPDTLLTRAADLYRPKKHLFRNVYRQLTDTIGWPNVYVLSAGWGLIRSDFRVPHYNITLSSQASRPGVLRSIDDTWDDFCHLTECLPTDTVHFVGGVDYLELLYRLTRGLDCRKIAYVASKHYPKAKEYEYVHFDAARDFRTWPYRKMIELCEDCKQT